MCVEDEKYIDESKLCDGVADCSSSEDENLHNCEEENRKWSNTFTTICLIGLVSYPYWYIYKDFRFMFKPAMLIS